MLTFDGAPDQAAGPLDEGKLVREAALQQHAHTEVSGYISHGDQRHVFSDAQMHQVVGFDQNKESPGGRRLDLGELTPEVLDKHLAQTFV